MESAYFLRLDQHSMSAISLLRRPAQDLRACSGLDGVGNVVLVELTPARKGRLNRVRSVCADDSVMLEPVVHDHAHLEVNRQS